MDRNTFITKVSAKLKLIRTEFGYSQETMAFILGISKKTLVEIEKGRTLLNWAGAISVCTLFSRSEILFSTFGGKPLEIILTLAFDKNEPHYNKKINFKLYWKTLSREEGYRVQKNLVSHLYRIVTDNERRVFSSFNFEEVKKKYQILNNPNQYKSLKK